MKERVTLNRKEHKRLIMLNQVEAGYATAGEVAETLGLPLRHMRRLLAAYRKEGAAALAHGNRGRKSHNTLALSRIIMYYMLCFPYGKSK